MVSVVSPEGSSIIREKTYETMERFSRFDIDIEPGSTPCDCVIRQRNDGLNTCWNIWPLAQSSQRRANMPASRGLQFIVRQPETIGDKRWRNRSDNSASASQSLVITGADSRALTVFPEANTAITYHPSTLERGLYNSLRPATMDSWALLGMQKAVLLVSCRSIACRYNVSAPIWWCHKKCHSARQPIILRTPQDALGGRKYNQVVQPPFFRSPKLFIAGAYGQTYKSVNRGISICFESSIPIHPLRFIPVPINSS